LAHVTTENLRADVTPAAHRPAHAAAARQPIDFRRLIRVALRAFEPRFERLRYTDSVCHRGRIEVARLADPNLFSRRLKFCRQF
jgi:hypothetical protein